MKTGIAAHYFKAIVFLSIITALNSATACPSMATEDKQHIRELINHTYDTPEHKVVIDPIIVKGEHAVAGWIQHNKGGRVLLFRTTDGKWNQVLCSGKAVKDLAFLIEAGVSPSVANELTKELIAAEALLGNEKIIQMDSFLGVVKGAHETHTDKTTTGHHH
jgi:hypothetical protein